MTAADGTKVFAEIIRQCCSGSRHSVKTFILPQALRLQAVKAQEAAQSDQDAQQSAVGSRTKARHLLGAERSPNVERESASIDWRVGATFNLFSIWEFHIGCCVA